MFDRDRKRTENVLIDSYNNGCQCIFAQAFNPEIITSAITLDIVNLLRGPLEAKHSHLNRFLPPSTLIDRIFFSIRT